MTHPRRHIRNAIAARLTGGTIAGDRVFAGRPAPIEEGELPAIVIHTREQEEVVDYPTSGWNASLVRKCFVTIDCILQSFDDIDDELDEYASQVEALLESWEIPGMESAEIRLATTSSEAEWEAGLSTGAVKLRYSVVYRMPFRVSPDPYVQSWDADWDEEQAPDGELNIYRSGAYPGGQVKPDGQTGEACPVGDAQLFHKEEPIN